MRRAALGALAVLFLTAAGEPAPLPVDEPASQPASQPVKIEARYSLDELGLAREVRRDAARDSVAMSLPTRADRVLTSARITLVFAARPPDPLLSGIEVLVNGERAGAFDSAQIANAGVEHTLPIDPAFLGTSNVLVLRFLRTAAPGECPGRLPVGSWALIARGRVELSAAPLKLASDLALLPLPFADTNFANDAAVHMAFLAPPAPEHLRAASMVASWFGLRAGAKLHFPVTIGDLPEEDAVVFADGAEAAVKLGLPVPTGPTLAMVDLGPRKLLVVAGRNPEEVTTAARALATGSALSGAAVTFKDLPEAVPVVAYAAPRWLAAGERVLFASVPNAGKLELEGAGGGTIRLEFRLPPDLFFWQAAQPSLDVGWSATMPPGAHAPRVTIEMNGRFVGFVPVTRVERGQAWGRGRLQISGDNLPGYNEVLIHVDYGRVACGTDADPARFTLDPESAFRLGPGRTHFASYPNLSLFVDDGFPFTRVPDLSETAAVVAATPAPHEIETLLSTVAHFAAVTGQPGTGLIVVGPDDLDSAFGRDLLVVGAADNHALIQRWGAQLPMVFERGRPFAQLPERSNMDVLLTWLSGRNAGAEASRAEEITSHDPGLAAAMAIESPLNRRRAAVILTAAKDARMPLIGDLQGTAESNARESDLLVSSRGTRWMFRLGTSYDVGELGSWRRFLRFLSLHWVALFPFILVGTFGLAVVLRAALRERVRVRTAQIGGTS